MNEFESKIDAEGSSIKILNTYNMVGLFRYWCQEWFQRRNGAKNSVNGLGMF